MFPKMRFHLSTAVVHTMERSRKPARDMAGEFPESAEDYGVPVFRMENPVASLEGTGLAAGSIVIDKCFSRIFVAAYLLTGNATQAEAVTLESLERLSIHATWNGCLSWKAIAAAIVPEDPDSEPAPDQAPASFPVELQRVLRLPPRLRQCFVLRVLMAMPRHYCAGLLRMDAEQVDANSCLAMQDLARMVTGEAPN
jgi:hypothetical protein